MVAFTIEKMIRSWQKEYFCYNRRDFLQGINMKSSYLVALALFVSASNVAYAAVDPEQLFVDGNCNNCHSRLEHHTVGPTIFEIGDKYRDDATALDRLAKKVRSGGVGVWGKMPMPGTRASISDADIKAILTWIMAQKLVPADPNKTFADTLPPPIP